MLVAGLLIASSAGSPAGAASAAKPRKPLISIGHYRHTVSQNHDGFGERLRIPLRLRREAKVRYVVRDLDRKRTVRRKVLFLDGSTRIPAGRTIVQLRDLHWADLSVQRGRFAVRFIVGKGGKGHTARTRFDVLPGPIGLDWHTLNLGGGHAAAFSPDGDGTRDRIRLGFVLERRSRVAVRVDDRRPISLGRLDAGRHAWRWNGKVRGRVVRDGDHEITLRAKPLRGHHRKAGSASTAVIVDTTAPTADAVRLNRSTVYPAATAIEDSLRIGVDLAVDDQAPDKAPDRVTSAQIRTSDGDLVRRLTPERHDCVYDADVYEVDCALLTWDARTATGPVPSGDYVLRLVLTDSAGNTTTVRRPVTVSLEQLVEQTGSITWAAADAPRRVDFCIANYCGEDEPCPPVPSERFTDGVSFRANPEECATMHHDGAADSYGYAPDLPDGSTPYDRFRVTMTGGPTAPATDDTGWVSVPGSTVTSPTGDGSVTTEWALVRPDVELFGDSYPRAPWRAGTSEPDRYDVASYTLEYTYYVPAG